MSATSSFSVKFTSRLGQVAELAYAHGLEPCSLRIEGSSPSLPTKKERASSN